MSISSLSPENETKADLLLVLGCAFLVFLATSLLFQAFIYLLGYSLTTISLWIGLLTAGIVMFTAPVPQKISWEVKAGLTMIFVAVLLVVGIVESYFFDLSWDGRDYHQRAISHLAQGWNPDYKTIELYNDYYSTILNCYPKAPWILSALLYRFSRNIEVGKITHLLLIISVFLLSASLFLRLGFDKLQILILSFLLAFNPVSAVQALTFYVDGILASLITLYVLIGCFSLLNLIPGWLELLSFGSVLVLGLNVKFNGVAYFGIVILGFLVLNLVVQKTRVLNVFFSHIILVALAMGLVGFNPYILNTIKYRNPFFPTLGGSILNISYNVEQNIPSNFKSMSSLEKLAYSVFSPSQNTYGRDTGGLKLPFFISSKELKAFIGADTRVGGWGPLFGGALLLSLVVGLYLLRSASRRKYFFVFWVGLILITVIVNPESWWARFSPQLWLIPVILLAGYWFSRINAGKCAAYLLAFTLLLNVCLVSGVNFYANLKGTYHIRTQLSQMQKTSKKVYVYFGPLEGTRTTLEYYHIPFEVVDYAERLQNPIVFSPSVIYSYTLKP